MGQGMARFVLNALSAFVEEWLLRIPPTESADAVPHPFRSDLPARCRALEEENARLRAERLLLLEEMYAVRHGRANGLSTLLLFGACMAGMIQMSVCLDMNGQSDVPTIIPSNLPALAREERDVLPDAAIVLSNASNQPDGSFPSSIRWSHAPWEMIPTKPGPLFGGHWTLFFKLHMTCDERLLSEVDRMLRWQRQ